ncbi:calcium/sodium antiporter [Halovivax gelatinilyticus]|uniref:calcium/sodium antiporter n=1 Tax=Halovivax gelatinilyticus TaxID=2961597 RepID=UPI0020CA559C|nr:calcium/sodium antiporter [Halovivax gelatinilyticus]
MVGDTVISIALLAAGAVTLYVGAELLVAGSGRIGHGLGLRAATVGVTLVAFATTAPELFVAIIGAIEVDPDVGLGAIVGSNIANIGLVLGLAALIKPLEVSETAFRRDVPFMVFAAFLTYGLARFDGQLGRLDAVIMLALLAAYTAYLIRSVNARQAAIAAGDVPEVDAAVASSRLSGVELRDALYVVAGLVAIVAGSQWLVSGGTDLLSELGFSPLFIGLTVLALGTSLPELAASVVGAIRGETAFAIGNVVGSNIYNLIAVLGLVAIVVPIPVETGTLRFELPAMVVFTVVLVAMLGYGRRLSRLDGAALVAGYVVFVYLLFP